jgi:Trypsin-like peptidase domain
MRRILVAAFFYFVLVLMALAQDAVPSEILARTVAIQVGNERGTAFSIDHHGTIYLVTARHVVQGFPEHNGIIQIYRPNGLTNYHIVRALFPPSRDVDIAVLETDEKISKPYDIALERGDEGPTMGQQVWFLGYPFRERLHSPIANGEIPFIKRGTMSAIDGSNPNAVVEYIDGFNNPGFSGGPIVYWDFRKHAYRITGVVMGYKTDAAQALVNGQQVDTQILVNSGVLVGYSIEHVLQAIEQGKKQ